MKHSASKPKAPAARQEALSEATLQPQGPRSRLLVVGARGLLGPWVVRAALEVGWGEVFGASRGALELAAAEPRLRACEFDASHAGAGRRLVEQLEPTALIVCAALSRLEQCKADPGLARALNQQLPEDLARAAAERGARLVFVSTDLVFGHQPPRPSGWCEDDARAPLSLYGESKARGEDLVRAAHPAALVARVPLLFGPLLPGSGPVASSASTSLLAAVQRGERPLLFSDEWRTPLEVGSAARALVELAQGQSHGLLHLSPGRRCSRLELAQRILSCAGIPANALDSASRASRGADLERPRDASLDGTLARNLLRTALEGPP